MNRFEREAARWDAAPWRMALARSVAEAIQAQVPLSGTDAALDYGCGTGLLTLALFLWCWRLFVTGYRLKS